MDTSKEYIKMCDCKEIQGKWVKYTDGYDFGHEEWRGEKPQVLHTLWLPRQDQIQEMMKRKGWKHGYVDGTKWWVSLEEINDFRYELGEIWGMEGITKKELKTWEQLWLAFYMHEKHSKIWEEGKWVKK